MLDCMAATMATYPSVFAVVPRLAADPRHRPGRRGAVDRADRRRLRGVHHQQRAAVPGLLRPDRSPRHDGGRRSRLGRWAARRRRDEFLGAVHEHTAQRTTAEMLADAALFRIPSGPVLDGSTVPAFAHFVEREVFAPDPTGRFLQPRVPYRISGLSPRPFGPAPAEGEHAGQVEWDAAPRAGAIDRRIPAAARRDPGGRLHRVVGRPGRRPRCSPSSAPTSSRSSR